MDKLQKENEALKEFVKTAETKTNELTGKLASYESLGTVEEITILAAKAEESEKAVVELTATKESLIASNEELTTKLTAYEALGSVEDINETSDKASELLSKYMDFGTIDQLEKVESFLTRFEATGFKIEDLETMASEAKLNEEAKVIADLTSKFNINEELAKKTMEFTGSFEAATNYLSQLFPSAQENDGTPGEGEGAEEKKDETVGATATIVPEANEENKETKKPVVATGLVASLLK